jgi:hypothetical protein
MDPKKRCEEDSLSETGDDGGLWERNVRPKVVGNANVDVNERVKSNKYTVVETECVNESGMLNWFR